MRRIWSNPAITCEWGEPVFRSYPCRIMCQSNVSFNSVTSHSLAGVSCRDEQDKPIFDSFIALLDEAKTVALKFGLPRWYEILNRPAAKENEAQILDSRSFIEHARFLDKSFDEGSPHDFALYRNYVWSLDEHLRFDQSTSRLQQCVEQEWLRMSVTEDLTSSPVPRAKIPEPVRHEVWRRDGGRCSHCGSREKLEFDHIIPLALGGSNTARNLELLCETCNRTKAASLSVSARRS